MAGTIREIAEIAGVSRGTVDRALNRRGRINREVAERIFQVAGEIGYVPKKQKQMAESTVKLGVVTQLCKKSFMVQIHKGIEDARAELKKRNVELVIEECMTVNEEEQLDALERLEQQEVDGIAIMPVEGERMRQRLNMLSREGVRIVTFNTDIIGTKRSCFVGLDNKKSGRTAAGLMNMLTGGQGKILAITGYFGNSVNSMRVDGFVEEVKTSFPGLQLIGVQSSFDEEAEVERIVQSTLQSFPDLKGIVVFSGGQAGVWKTCQNLKIEPRPFVIVYDLTVKNIQALKDNNVDFLIDQNGYTQGYRSLFALADLIQTEEEPVEEYLYTDIIIKTKYNL